MSGPSLGKRAVHAGAPPGTEFPNLLLAVKTPVGLQAAGPVACHLAGSAGRLWLYYGASGRADDTSGRLRELLTAAPGLRPFDEVLVRHPGDVCASILDTAHCQGAHLVVVTSHTQSLSSHLLVGSTTEALIRRADRPILCVPLLDQPEPWSLTGRILVAFSGWAVPDELVTWGVQLAQQEQALLEFMAVIPLHHGCAYEQAPHALVGRPRESPLPEHGSLERDLLERIPRRQRSKFVVRWGDPADETLSHAQAAGAGLIIIGSCESRRPRQAFIGSPTERLLRRSRQPVLVVPFEPRRCQEPWWN